MCTLCLLNGFHGGHRHGELIHRSLDGRSRPRQHRGVQAEGVDEAGGVTPVVLPLGGVTTTATVDPELVPTVDVLLGVDGETESAKDGGRADSFVALLNED